MAAIGYDYDEQELGQAMMVPGTNLTADKAIAARRACEEFIDDIVLRGNADYGWDGLINNANVTKSDAPDGAGGSPEWSSKTALEIVKDVNDALMGVYVDSLTVEMADTICWPTSVWSALLSTVIDGTHVTMLDFIQRNNVWTKKTGMPLMMREIRGLENAAANNKGRMIAYRRDPSVLRFHLPMPHRFYAPQQQILRYIVPGIFRLGGLEIRRPKAIRYLDKITA